MTVEEGLHALIARGFRFQHIAGPDGELTIIVGTYGWPEFCDRIEIHGELEASAARTGTGPAGKAVWGRRGDTVSVIAALLALPVRKCPLWMGRRPDPAAKSGCPGEAVAPTMGRCPGP